MFLVSFLLHFVFFLPLSVPGDRVEHLVLLDFVLVSALNPVGSSSAVSPVVLAVSFAGVFIDPLSALLALDVAAPVEFALAFVSPENSAGVVASAAAHDVAAVGAHGRGVASAAGGAQAAGGGVRVTVVGGRLEVDQVGLCLLFQGLVDGDELVAALVHGHLGRRVVFLLEIFSDGLELLHGDPAGANGAGSGNSVAFALEADEALHGFASGAVVVQVHQVARVFASFAAAFAGVDEQLGELGAVPDVVGTAAPLEYTLLITTGSATTIVALAVL